MCIKIFRQVFQVPLFLFWDGLHHCVAQAGLSLSLPTSASVCGVVPGLCHCPQPYILPKDALRPQMPFSFLPVHRVVSVTGERSWNKNMLRLTQWVTFEYGHMCHSARQKSEDRLGCCPSPTTLFEARVSHFITMNAIYSGSYWVRRRSLLCQPKWLKSWRSQNTEHLYWRILTLFLTIASQERNR